MAKKIIVALLAVILVTCAFCSLVSCSASDEQLKIVYLGDSIAEAIIGPSPLSERDNYGYYAVNGKRNEYVYINRSVSGHRTSAMLELISREDENAQMTKTHIQTADIIQVSILGNDLLQEDLTGLLIEFAKEINGEIAKEDTQREEILRNSHVVFAAIIAKLKELNPTATLIIQTVYNPVYVGTRMVGQRARDILPEYGYNDDPTGENSYRELGGKMLECLNEVVFEYHDKHPDDFYIVDVAEAFQKIYSADPVRGAKLIFPDGVHPSNEGHAVIADASQRLLEKLGLANEKKALKNYKDLRVEQLKRLFPTVGKDVRKAINNASSIEEVTEIYFKAIDGILPELA